MSSRVFRIRWSQRRIWLLVLLLTAALAGLAPWWRLFAEPHEAQPSWSPDGRQIVYVCNDRLTWRGERRRKWDEICISDAQGQHARRVTHNKVPETDPAWLPGGEGITFVVDQDAPALYQATTTALPDRNPVRLDYVFPDIDYYHWSPSGKQLAFSVLVRGEYRTDLYVTTPSKGAVEYISPLVVGSDFSWSPDGQSLTFVSGELMDNGVNIVNLRDLTIRRITGGDGLTDHFDPVWSPSGQHVAYLGRGAEPFEFFHVYVINVVSLEIERIWEDGGALAWSPDGRYLAFVSGVEGASMRDLNPSTDMLRVWDTATGTVTSYRFDAGIVFAWSPHQDSMMVGDGADWNGDGHKLAKLWHLDLATGEAQPITKWWLRGNKDCVVPLETVDTDLGLP